MHIEAELSNSLLGGFLIGTVVACRHALFGKVTGISGIAGGLVKLDSISLTEDKLMRFGFVIGLMVAGGFYSMLNRSNTFDDWSRVPLAYLVVSGLLVGWGTTTGNGCTSGHGICGVSKFRPRSIIATAVFIASGMLTATLSQSSQYFSKFENKFNFNTVKHTVSSTVVVGVLTVAGAYLLAKFTKNKRVITIYSSFAEFIYGGCFGIALVVAGMVKPSATLAFLDLLHWYPVLALVMIGAYVVTLPVLKLIDGSMNRPILTDTFLKPSVDSVDVKLLLGEAAFGVGWGLTGSCPGPALVNLARFEVPTSVFAISLLLGVWLAQSQDATKMLHKK